MVFLITNSNHLGSSSRMIRWSKQNMTLNVLETEELIWLWPSLHPFGLALKVCHWRTCFQGFIDFTDIVKRWKTCHLPGKLELVCEFIWIATKMRVHNIFLICFQSPGDRSYWIHFYSAPTKYQYFSSCWQFFWHSLTLYGSFSFC